MSPQELSEAQQQLYQFIKEKFSSIGWLSPLHDLNDTGSFVDAGNSHPAIEHSTPADTAPVRHLSSISHSRHHFHPVVSQLSCAI